MCVSTLFRVCALCALITAATAAVGRTPGPPTSTELDAPLTRLAFGSCNKHDFPQPAWRAIAATRPDAFLWLGDVVYADVRVWKRPLSAPLLFEPAPLDSVRAKLAAQQSHTEYAHVRNSTPVLGIWDDHDSAANNGGVELSEARRRQLPAFLDFLDEPVDSARRTRPSGAIYTSYVFGRDAAQQVKVILLDTRSLRGAPLTGDMLGEEQWAWLEDELRDSSAQLHFIASGIQVLPVDKLLQEKWRSHPGSYERLLQLLTRHQTRGAILLSGDVHWAELFRSPCTEALGYALYELTSSGLTHSCATQAPLRSCNTLLHSVFADRFRMRADAEYTDERAAFAQCRNAPMPPSPSPSSSSTLAPPPPSQCAFRPAPSPSLPDASHPALENASLAAYFAAPVLADWASVYDSQRHFVYGDMNFGLIEIDWQARRVSLQARRAWDGQIAFEAVLPFHELQRNGSRIVQPTTAAADADVCARGIHAWRLWPAEYFLPFIMGALLFALAFALALCMCATRCAWRRFGAPCCCRTKVD